MLLIDWNLQTASHRGRLRKEKNLEQDILEFCQKRNIEIHIRHYLVKDCIRIRLRKGDKITEKIIPRHDGKISEIETDLEIAVRSMADELDRA